MQNQKMVRVGSNSGWFPLIVVIILLLTIGSIVVASNAN